MSFICSYVLMSKNVILLICLLFVLMSLIVTLSFIVLMSKNVILILCL